MAEGRAQHWFKQFVDSTGTPVQGVKVYHYAAGTTNDQDIWHDAGKTTTHSQPYVGDPAGMASFYADGDYRLLITDANDNTLWDFDNVRITADQATAWEGSHGTSFPGADTLNKWHLFTKHSAADVFEGLGISTPTGYNDIASVISAGWVNVKSHGAAGNGTTDDTAAIQAAADALAQDDVLFFPAGKYLISSKITVDMPCSIFGLGATLLSDGGLTDYMMRLEFAQTINEQRSQDTKQVGFYAGLTFDGADSANGLEMSRIYRSHFDQLFFHRCKGTVWRFDRVIESVFTNCTIIDCLADGTEPMVDLSWNNGGSDQSNMVTLTGCSFEASSHPVFWNCDTASDATNFAVRRFSFFGCLFHGVTTGHDTNRLTVDNDLILVDLNEVNDFDFYDCTFQNGASTAGVGVRWNGAQNCRLWGGAMLDQTGTSTALKMVTASGTNGHLGTVINSDMAIDDAGQGFEASTGSRWDVDHIRYTDARIAALYSNSGATLTSGTRSPKTQYRNPNAKQLNEYVQQNTVTRPGDAATSDDRPAAVFEVTDAVSGTKSLFFEAMGEYSALFMGGTNDPNPATEGEGSGFNLGRSGFEIRAMFFEPTTTEPRDKAEGMVVYGDGTWRDKRLWLWNGTSWVSV